jgi:hypothetical protein
LEQIQAEREVVILGDDMAGLAAVLEGRGELVVREIGEEAKHERK